MVSLLAGLMLTLSLISLARSTTSSIFEQTRISTAETGVRNAAERLRADLARASFMGTGNIKWAVSTNPNVPAAQRVAAKSTTATTGSRDAFTHDLQGVRIIPGGSNTGPVAALTTLNSVNPDILELTANFTTPDAYAGLYWQGTTGRDRNARNYYVDTIELRPDLDPAVGRLLNAEAGHEAAQLAALTGAFMPGDLASVADPRFLVRIVDPNGCLHFGFVQAVRIADVSVDGVLRRVALIELDPAHPSPDPAAPERGAMLALREAVNNCGGSGHGAAVTVSPLLTVRWRLEPSDVALAPDNATPTNTKFDLTRSILTADGRVVLRELIAEYIVDLKFGISVAQNQLGGLGGGFALTTFDMDSTPAADMATWTGPASSTANGVGPQRIRSIQFRVAARASLDDRTTNEEVVANNPNWRTRYCVDPAPPGGNLAGCTRWARVRTITSEVALLNQLGMTY